MADKNKAESAKERLESAKKAAEDAQVVETPAEKAATDSPESPDQSDKTQSDKAQPGDVSSAAETSSSDKTDDAAIDDAPEAETTDPDEIPILDAEPGPIEEPEEPVPHEEEPPHPSFAATALKFLLIFLLGCGVVLWAAPRIAPSLPAPISAWLMPGQMNATEMEARLTDRFERRLNTVQTETTTAIEQLQADIEGTSAAVSALETSMDSRIADATAGGQGDADVTARVDSIEATLEGLRAELDTLSGFSGESETPSAAVLERVAAFGAAVEGLRKEVEALSARGADLQDLAARVSALESGEAATAGARSTADQIIRDAQIDAALTRLDQELAAGRTFAAELEDLTDLTGANAPDALLAVAETGAPTRASLMRRFPGAAQSAYAADLAANADESWASGVLARVQGRIGGRPSVETAGDDVGATLSRIEARLREGDLAAAEAEAEALPPDARAAMSGWLASLATALDAASGLSALRTSLTEE